MTYKNLRTLKLVLLILQILAFLMLFQAGAFHLDDYDYNYLTDGSIFEAVLEGFIPALLLFLFGWTDLIFMVASFCGFYEGSYGEEKSLRRLLIGSVINWICFLFVAAYATDKAEMRHMGEPVVEIIGILLAITCISAVMFALVKKYGINVEQESVRVSSLPEGKVHVLSMPKDQDNTPK